MGAIIYDHSVEKMQFFTNNTERWIISSSGTFYPAGTLTADIGASSNYVNLLYTKSVRYAGLTFATLSAPSNGTTTYCSDCTIANPCAGAGTGAFAKRLNGVWVCN